MKVLVFILSIIFMSRGNLYSQEHNEAIYQNINIHLILGDTINAEKIIDSAIRSNLEYSWLYLYKAELLVGKTKNYIDNIDTIAYYYEKAIDLDSTNSNAILNLGIAYYNTSLAYRYESNVCPDIPKLFRDLETKSSDYIFLAFEYIKKANELNPNDDYASDIVKQIEPEVKRIKEYLKKKKKE